MTGEEMQALVAAPEGCEWSGCPPCGGAAWWAALRTTTGHPFDVRMSSIYGSTLAGTGILLTDFARHPAPLDALLALRRLAGHLWPWPGWPVVEGVRPAGWGPRPGQEEAAAHADTVDTLGYWLRRTAAGILTAEAHYRAPTGDGMFCAIDRDGRWVEVDTRGGR